MTIPSYRVCADEKEDEKWNPVATAGGYGLYNSYIAVNNV